jgi:hypothetical protein
MKDYHFKNVLKACIPYLFKYFNRTFKVCSINFYQPLLRLLVDVQTIHIHPSLFIILECSFYLMT